MHSLILLLNEYCPEIEIAGTAHSAAEGIKEINIRKPDLVFLDVEMPHTSGFDLLEILPERKFDVKYLTAKDCIFRIYNDTRFYKNKPPYKTNMGAFMAKGGKNAGNAGYYFHIEPHRCFLGGGIYMPHPDRLKLIRQEIYYNMDKFLSIIENKNFKKYFNKIEGEKTSRIPKGFPADIKGSEWLKYKSYTILHSIKPETLSDINIKNTSSGFSPI